MKTVSNKHNMGKVICQKHGEQFFFETCEHYYSDFNNNLDIEFIKIEILNLKICRNCYEKNGFAKIVNLKMDEVLKLNQVESERIQKLTFDKYNTLNRKIICPECYSDFKEVIKTKNH